VTRSTPLPRHRCLVFVGRQTLVRRWQAPPFACPINAPFTVTGQTHSDMQSSLYTGRSMTGRTSYDIEKFDTIARGLQHCDRSNYV